MGCMRFNAAAYATQLKLFLRRGDAWDLPEGGTFDRLLHALAEEFARLNASVCDSLTVPDVGLIPGWSAPEYEQLIKSRWGIDCVVTDMHWEPLHANSAANSLINARPWQMIFVITIPGLKFYEPSLASHAVAGDELVADRVPILPDGMVQYLLAYKQSHTAFMFRRARGIETQVTAYHPTRASEAVVGDVLIESDQYVLTLEYDAIYDFEDLPQLEGWADAQALYAQYTQHFSDSGRATRAGEAVVGDELLEVDYYRAWQVEPRIEYKPVLGRIYA